MKKTMGKLKQALSIVLAVAMIVTCLPQTGISVMAAEGQSAESSDEPDVSVDTAEDETNESNESASVEDEADEPEEADTEEEAEEKEEEITIPKYDAREEGSGEENQDSTSAADPFDESKVTISVSGNDTASVTNKALSKESGSESYSFEAKAKDGYEIAEITAVATVSGNNTPVTLTCKNDTNNKISEEDGTEDGYKKYTVPLTSDAISGAGTKCENLTKLEITVETKAIPLEITVEAAEEAEHYTVTLGERKGKNQYFTVTPAAGYMISPTDNNAVTARKDKNVAAVTKDANGYYVEVTETYGKVEIVVTANVVEAVTVTITKDDEGGAVSAVRYTTDADPKTAVWKDIDVSGNDAAVTLASKSDLKIKFTLADTHKVKVEAEENGEEKAVTLGTNGEYTVKNITKNSNVNITTTPIQYKIVDPVITVGGKNVTKWEIDEIEDEIKEIIGATEKVSLVKYEEDMSSLNRGEALEFKLITAPGEPYYVKSVKCKFGSDTKTMTYDTNTGKYKYTFSQKEFSKLQDGDTITVVIDMEKAWKVTFDLRGVTVKDARDTEKPPVEITGNTLYIRKDATNLALTAEMDKDEENPEPQLREAWYQAGTKQTDIKSKVNGEKFSIPITADTIVTIKSTAKEHYKLQFDNWCRGIITVSDVKLGGKDISGNDWIYSIEEGTVTSNNKITFRADVKAGYKKPDVSIWEFKGPGAGANIKILTPNASGVYELSSLNADSLIAFSTELDAATCNVLEIKSDSKLSNAYTATLTVSGNEVNDRLPNDNNTYLVPLEAAEGVLTIDLNPGYKNLEVKLNDKPMTPDVTGNDPENSESYGYKIPFTKANRKQEITVSVEEEAATDDTTVKFANTAPHMSYKVDTKDGKVRQVPEVATGKVSNTYIIDKDKGGRSIQFTVTAANAYYKPVVKVNDVNGNEIAPISEDTKKRIYTYSIAAANIINSNTDEDNIIYIDETSDVWNVSVKYKQDAGKVSADVGGGIQNPQVSVKDTEVTADYSVTDGDTINFNFKVSVNDNYKLVNIIAKNLTTGKETKVTKNSISVKADADYEVTVNTQALTAIYVNEGKVSVPMNKNKSYSVKGGSKYVVEVYNGADQAQLKSGGLVGIDSAVTFKDGKATVTIDRAEAANIKKAKQLTLKLKDKDKKEYTVTLELLPLAGVKKVDGVKTVNKQNVLTQTVNTTKIYAITMNPATAAVTLGARVTKGEEFVKADVDGRTLIITTVTDNNVKNLATVELYDTTAPEENSEDPLYTIDVTTELPKLPTPTVALQSADDTTLTLTLGAKNLALPDAGKGNVYYKVEVKADETAKGKLTTDQKARVKSVEEYFEIEAVDGKGSTSQTENVEVITGGLGSGFASTFDVTVTLVQSKGTKSSETENDGIDELTSSKSVPKKGLKTKEPAYATKITFKKGASAVYTNQKDVLAATAVFDKNATYTTLIGEGSGAPKDLSYTGDDSDKALEISIENGNQILVSATPKTAPGKHVIRVTADNGAGKGADTMRQTTADYTVTVERAIEEIKLNNGNFIPVYKAPGKAASFTVGIAYNEGTTQPKAKKVNWTITDEKGNELSKEEARGVTVKNGKVTIPKDYIMTEVDGEGMCDYFWVTATAADVTDNLKKAPVVSDPVEVYIYNWVESMGETILVKGIGQPDGGVYKNLKVIARSGGTVRAEELKGAQIYVLKKGVVDKEEYNNDELIDYESVSVDMTYKVNNKAIVLGEGGYVEEVNGGNLKNVTITATTADGSNLKSELKNLKVNYYEPKEYGLAVKQMTPWDDIETQVLHQDNAMYDFSGALDTVFELQVMELLEDEWDELSAASNYTLAVTGASILEKDVIKGTYKIIGSNKEITVKLTDKTKKTNSVTYKLHNKTVSTAQAPKLTATPNSNLIAGTHRGDQQIKYSLTGFKGDPKETRVLITLDAKDSTNIKNQARYEAFARDCNKFLNNTDYTVEELQNGGLVFGTEGSTDIPAGTYKLTVNFGSFDDKGDFFVAIAKPVTLTVKVSAPKKASVKLNNKYTLSIHNAAAGAPVTLNNMNVILTAVSVVNDNVNGKENNFTKYFKITKEEDGTFVLRIKNDLSIADLNYIKDTKKAKNDLTGWVTYTYDDGIFEPETMQAQITIARYAEPQYSMDSGNVISGEGMTVDLSARANGNKVAVEHAYTEASTLAATGIADGNVRFTVKGNAKTQNVYIVPDTSAYTKALEELSEAIETAEEGDGKKVAETAYANAVKACGVMVKVTVTVK